MSCFSSSYTGIQTHQYPWHNFVESIQYHIPSFFKPASIQDLTWILREAEVQQKKVRPVGRGWSIEALAVSEDWVVELSDLNQELNYVLRSHGQQVLTQAWRNRLNPSTGDHLIHMEAGIRILDLNQYLSQLGLAMPTLGGAQGQHLAGAISTSTHGSDYKLSPLPSLVQAIHLVTVGGKQVWVEAASRPLTQNDELLRQLLPCPDTEIIRDDDLFNAVLVGLGRFGVIYSVVLKVTKAFRLSEFANELTWSEVAAALREGIREPMNGHPFTPLVNRLADPPFALLAGVGELVDKKDFQYVDLALNPRSDDKCWVRRRWRTNHATDLNLAEGPNPLCHPGVAQALIQMTGFAISQYAAVIAGSGDLRGLFKSPYILGKLPWFLENSANSSLKAGEALALCANMAWDCQLDKQLDVLVTFLNQTLLSNTFSKSLTEGKAGPSWQVTSGLTESAFDPDCFNGTAVEIIFDASQPTFIDFIDRIVKAGPDYHQVGYVSVRFSHRTDATLSMYNLPNEMGVSIEVTALKGLEGTANWLRWVEEMGKSMGGRPHWGQKHSLLPSDIERLYGEKAFTEWRDQLRRIVGNSFTFSNAYTRGSGLEPTGFFRDVTHIKKKNGVVTHFCHPGAYWSPIPVETAMQESIGREVFYRVLLPDGRTNPIYVEQYLTTPSDDKVGNNLASLPVVQLDEIKQYHRTAPLGERQVTHVYKSKDIWQSVSLLVNKNERWVIYDKDAQNLIELGIQKFYRLDSSGNQIYLQPRRRFTTEKDGIAANNLESLPLWET